MSQVFGGAKGGDTSGAQFQQQEEARKAELRAKVNALFDDPAAKDQFGVEDKQLGDSLRSYHTDELGRQFADASRALRFKAADSGNLGSAYADQLSRLERDNQLGATRVDEAVRTALASLNAQREASRTNALTMINGGSGAEAVNAATAGLKNSIDLASAQQKQQLFGDLFSDVASGKVAADKASRQQQMLESLKNRTSSYVNPVSGGGGTVIPYGSR